MPAGCCQLSISRSSEKGKLRYYGLRRASLVFIRDNSIFPVYVKMKHIRIGGAAAAGDIQFECTVKGPSVQIQNRRATITAAKSKKEVSSVDNHSHVCMPHTIKPMMAAHPTKKLITRLIHRETVIEDKKA
jgi:hypothetical protein